IRFWFLFFAFVPSLVYSAERPDVIIKKNAQASLASVVKTIHRPGETLPTFFINELIVGEGADLYLAEDVTINAKRIILKSGSVISTLGHSLTLKTDEFLVLNFNPNDLSLTQDQKKTVMGRIDTRFREGYHDGKNGQEHPPTIQPKGRNAYLAPRPLYITREGGNLAEPGISGEN